MDQHQNIFQTIIRMIQQQEIDQFWKEFRWIMFKWNVISFIGIITGGVIIAFILKHVFKVKFKFWWLNDTVDGDFGAEWWLEREGLKPGIISAIRWWFRNHSWNYISKFNPEWNAGSVDVIDGKPEMKIIDCDVDVSRFDDGIFHWMKREDGIGKIYVAYRINGHVYCRKSEVTKGWFGRLYQRQCGAGGRRFKFNKKPII